MKGLNKELNLKPLKFSGNFKRDMLRPTVDLVRHYRESSLTVAAMKEYAVFWKMMLKAYWFCYFVLKIMKIRFVLRLRYSIFILFLSFIKKKILKSRKQIFNLRSTFFPKLSTAPPGLHQRRHLLTWFVCICCNVVYIYNLWSFIFLYIHILFIYYFYVYFKSPD